MSDPTQPSHRAGRITLGLVVVFLGGSGLVYEYCLSTLATHLLGNSIEQFSLIIALMLFAMGIAGLAQRWLGDGPALAETFVMIEVLLALIGGTSSLLLYLAFAYLEHFRLALYSLAFLIGFGVGLEIPIVLRLNALWSAELKSNVGEVFSLDYIGALMGALVWSFILLPFLSLDQISLVLGGANLIAAIAALFALRSMIKRPWRMLGMIASACIILILGAFYTPDLIYSARQHLYAFPIRHHEKSVYQDMVVTGAGARMSLYLNGHLQFDSEDEYIYHEMLVHPALSCLDQPPKTVLVLGGGDGLAVREILRWPSVERVVLVDLDPAVTELARTYPPLVAQNQGALQDARVQPFPPQGVTPGAAAVVEKAAERPRDALAGHQEAIAEVFLFHVDADAFVRPLGERFDAIIADFPDPSSPDLAKLFSLEMYLQIARRLSPGGVLAVQSSSPYTNRRAFWAVRDTLEAAGFTVLSLHAHIPTFGEWGWHIGRLAQTPSPRQALPFEPRYAEQAVVDAAAVFPKPMSRPQGTPRVSTRLDPQVMRLYLEGEPLSGPALFAGSPRR